METIREAFSRFRVCSLDIGIISDSDEGILLNQDMSYINAELFCGINPKEWVRLMDYRFVKDYKVPKDAPEIEGIRIKSRAVINSSILVILHSHWCDVYRLIERNNSLTERICSYIQQHN